MKTLLTLVLLTSPALADLSRFENDFKMEDKEDVGFSRGSLKMIEEAKGKKTFNPGGVDFSGCETDPETGMCCLMKEEQVTSLEKQPILECTHKEVEQCHYTYVTKFHPTKEEICEETFDKKCSISFTKTAQNETVQKCYTPLVKICGDGQLGGESESNLLSGSATELNTIPDNLGGYGSRKKFRRIRRDAPLECKTYYESSCTTRYKEKSPGKFVGDTSCEKLPIELCGTGCKVEQGQQECHDKTVASLLDVPQEVCDLNPVKTCRFATKLVPHLTPIHQCTLVPKEVCVLKFDTPKQVQKPLVSRWCLDTSLPTPQNDLLRSQEVSMMPRSNQQSLSQANSQNGTKRKPGRTSTIKNNMKHEMSKNQDVRPLLADDLESYGEVTESSITETTTEVIALQESYGLPEEDEEPLSIDESYGAPGTEVTPIEEEYIINGSVQETVANNFLVPPPDKNLAASIEAEIENIAIDEGYIGPQESSEASSTYGAPFEDDEHQAGNETNFEDIDGIYSAPGPPPDYDYNEDYLSGYASNAISDTGIKKALSNSRRPTTGYTIDRGFDENLSGYTGPDSLSSYNENDNGLTRHLLPPAHNNRHNQVTTDEIKANKNRIRSVDPYYRI